MYDQPRNALGISQSDRDNLTLRQRPAGRSLPVRTKDVVKSIAPQLVVIGVILILHILAWVSLLPPPRELPRLISELVAKHGFPLIVIASFVENLAGIGTYFPASVALVAAMASTAGDPHRASLMYCAIVLPAIAANIASYTLGYFTRTGDPQSAPRSSRSLAIWYFTTYWHPQLAAVTAMVSGAEGVPFLRYLAFFLPLSITWTIVWAVILYNAGRVFDGPNVLMPLFYLYLTGWLLWDLRKHMRRSTPRTSERD